MARKSRKVDNATSLKKIYKVGAYVRLSILNNNTNDESTIENQKNIILDYINKNDDFKLIDIYEDNNKTGRNFERNEFQRLLNDIKLKKINCIIVKDLSRFGRDYKECTNYIENILPFLNVRFIAINDMFDSNNINGNDILSMQLKNIINEFYSKDISKKILASLTQKKESGEHLCAFAPYGYLKDKENKGKIIIDNNVNQVVIDIFNWRLQNYSCSDIALKLEKLNIDSPAKYFYKIGILKSNKYANTKWNREAVNRILKNDIYIGNLCQGKYTKRVENNKKQLPVNKESWIIKENNHTPIIDKETFYKVQAINENVTLKYNKNKYTNKKEDILKGLLKCGCCGRNLTKRVNIKTYELNKVNIQNRIICEGRYKVVDKCNFKGIREDVILKTILETIKLNIKLSKDINKIIEFKEYTNKINLHKQNLIKEINITKEKIQNIEYNYEKLYNDYLDGVLSKVDYIFIKDKYITKQDNFIAHLNVLEQNLKEFEKNIINNEFLNNFLILNDNDILNREILLNLIESITIYSNKSMKIKFKFFKNYEILNEYLFDMGVI
ncbi:recombinase family protein [[Clostridium] colinum]|uniref:recombinase family protein n=1 Tax=[Clostridium] colinum TaxID=36835 RepID=UPI0020259FB1|nr:recombinase family protein [[Clostridium] colinum]